MPDKHIPKIDPTGVINEKQTINFNTVSLSILDLFKCIP
jgi:hypothetical protein